MKRTWMAVLLIPLALGALLWMRPPDGHDAYFHSVYAVEQVRAWHEGAVFPRYHRAWNGGTGTFVPTIYAPIPLAVQGGLAWLVGDGQRAVGLSLALALLTTGFALVRWGGTAFAVVIMVAPYVVAVSLARATTTEAWALAGAAVVLPLALPQAPAMTRSRGLALALGVLLIAGSQVGMLIELGWLLAIAWAVSLGVVWKESEGQLPATVRACGGVVSWASAGFMVGAVFWLPAVVDGRHLEMQDFLGGAFDWRNNFLPDASRMGLFLTVTASSLLVIALVVSLRRERPPRYVLGAVIAAGVFFSTPLATPLWHLPKMENLQFPWRFLGPATLAAVLAVAHLAGRWKATATIVLLVPLTLLPVNLGTATDSVPTSSSPEELARIGQRQWGLVPTLPTTSGLYSTGFHRLGSLARLAGQSAQVDAVERDALGGVWRVTTEEPTTVLLPLQWWPEWRIEADGKPIAYSNQWGLVAVEEETGTVEVRASLAPSRSRIAGLVLSAVGCLALVGLFLAWTGGWESIIVRDAT